MLQLPGPASLIAVGLYAVAAFLAARAWRVSGRMVGVDARGQWRMPGWHRATWLVALALFAVCAVSRLLGIEEALRTAFRGELQAERLYDMRREAQAAVASGVIVFVALAGMAVGWGLRRMNAGRKDRLSRIAAGAAVACTAMVLLIALRMISLHMIDSLLYRGPRLNWLIDIGSTLAVLGLAWRYAGAAAKPSMRPTRERHSERSRADEPLDR